MVGHLPIRFVGAVQVTEKACESLYRGLVVEVFWRLGMVGNMKVAIRGPRTTSTDVYSKSIRALQ